MSRPRTPAPIRFWAKVDPGWTDDCWTWNANTDKDGYGIFSMPTGGPQARNVKAHRWAYEQYVGPIPDGLVIDHLCRNRGCVNPGHLEPVTARENTVRSDNPVAKLMRGELLTRERLPNGTFRTGAPWVAEEDKINWDSEE